MLSEKRCAVEGCAVGGSGRWAEGGADLFGQGQGVSVAFVDEHVDGADASCGAALPVVEFDKEGDRGGADFFHRGKCAECFARPHRPEKVGFGMTQRGDVRLRGEPCFPTKGRVTDEVLHCGVGEGQGAGVENDPGRVGVIEADEQGLFSCQHAVAGEVKRKAARLGMRKAVGAVDCRFFESARLG